MVIFNSYVSLPEGMIEENTPILSGEDLGLWMPMMPRFPWDPHQWHTNSTREQPRGPWPFELILCRCMHCLEAVQGLRQTFSKLWWELKTNLTMQTDIILRFYEWGCQPFAPYDRTSIHKICIQQISRQLGLPEAASPIFPMNPWISPQLSCYNGRKIWGIPIFSSNPQTFFVNSEFFIVESPDLLCGLPISAGKPRHVWWLSHLNYITHSYGLLLTAS